MAAVFLGLGSNLGDKEANIREALGRLARHPNVRLEQVSSLYETAPIGFTEQPDFVNAVVLIETRLSPVDLLHAVLGIENDMGRVRNRHWGPRVIDIDLLLFNNTEMDTPELTLPHPRMMERAFVMAPLAEIAPDLELPGGRKPQDVLEDLKGQRVRRLAEVN